MRFYKIPGFLQTVFPQFVWRKSNAEKTIFLTFDDGPIPEITDFVLETLETYQAKATFFCVGNNLQKYPEIAEKALASGHLIANHTMNHSNGWKTSTSEYVENIKDCQNELELINARSDKRYFRPPYGKLTPAQARYLLQNQYQVIMWDVLTYDFDKTLQPEICLQKAILKTGNGSVVVFHDSLKAAINMQFVLPRFLQHFSEKGYSFQTL